MAEQGVRPAPWALLGFVLAAIALAWFYAAFHIDLHYWLHPNEYAELSMGYALNIDQWLTGSIGRGRRSLLNNYVSPALPHQIASWLAYRLADGWRLTQADNLAVSTLADPQRMFLLQRLLVLAGTLAALARLFILVRPMGARAALAITLSPLVYMPIWEYGVFFLDDPSIAPLMGALFLGALLATLGRSEGEPARRDWIVLGFIGIMAYSVKMHYAAWLIAAAGGIGAAVLVGRMSWGQAIRAGFWVLLGMAISLELLAFLLDGKFTHNDIVKMFAFHVSVVSGHESQNLPGAGAGLSWLSIPPKTWPALVLIVGLLLALAVCLARVRSRPDGFARALPFGVVLVLIYLAGLYMFVKFPSERYLVSTVVMVPAGLYAVLRLEPSPALRLVAIPLTLCAAAAGALQLQTEAARKEFEAPLKADREAILALPLEPQDLRLWAYRVLMPEYNIRLALQWSGNRDLDERVGNRVIPQDQEYNIWKGEVRLDRVWRKPADIPWRYAVLWGHVESDALPPAFRETPHTLKHLRQVTIVERAAAP
jgi:hypothetical protein